MIQYLDKLPWTRFQPHLNFGRFEPCWTGRAAWDIQTQRHLTTLQVLESIPDKNTPYAANAFKAVR